MGFAVSLLTLLVPLVKWVANYFSASEELGRRKLDAAKHEARVEVEGERLRSTYDRITAAPPAADKAAELNRRFGG